MADIPLVGPVAANWPLPSWLLGPLHHFIDLGALICPTNAQLEMAQHCTILALTDDTVEANANSTVMCPTGDGELLAGVGGIR